MVERTEVTWHAHNVTRSDREKLSGHAGCVVWFTGLSGCGKSTVANLVDRALHDRGIRTCLLDGDNVRHGLNASPEMLSEDHDQAFAERFGLGFAPQDREENIRRIGAVAQLFVANGIITLTAFVSPYRKDRDAVRKAVESAGRSGDFVEVLVDAPLAVCEARDPKGLYKKARRGELTGMTGIDDPYEEPVTPELKLDSASQTPTELAQQVVEYLRRSGRIESK